MQPWQIDKAKRELAGWSETELAELVELTAQVDADTKGASRDPEYSVEKLLLDDGLAKRGSNGHLERCPFSFCADPIDRLQNPWPSHRPSHYTPLTGKIDQP